MKNQFKTLFFSMSVSLLLMGCGDVNFGATDSKGLNGPSATEGTGSAEGGESAVVDNGEGSVAGNVSQPSLPGATTGGSSTPTTGTGDTPIALLPKLQFVGPPCLRLTNCEIEFRLDKAYDRNTEFNWRTDDEGQQCQSNPPILPVTCGRPNIEYVPNFGRVVFPPGVTSVKVYVRNINPVNVPIRIDVFMSDCQFGVLKESCTKFFNQ